MYASQKVGTQSLPTSFSMDASSAPTQVNSAPQSNMNEGRTLRSVRGLPELPKLTPLSVAVEEQLKYGGSPIAQDLSNHDGHTYESPIGEGSSSYDGRIHEEPEGEAEQNDAFSFQENTEELYRRVETQAEANGFSPPPESEVLEYSKKPLPRPHDSEKNPKEWLEEDVQRIAMSVPVHKPAIYLQPEGVRGSCAASIHVVVEDDMPAATSQTQPVPTAWFNRIQKREQWDYVVHDGRRRSLRPGE